jgi:hypothetical protein
MTAHWRSLGKALAVAGLLTLAGCGGGGRSAEEQEVARRLDQWLRAWETLDSGALSQFYRSGFEVYSYWFDAEDRDAHLATLTDGVFPNIRSFRERGTGVQMDTVGGVRVAQTRADFTAQAYTAISIYGLTPEVFDWASVGGTIRQIWVQDSLGDWVIAEEYFSRFWVRERTPTIDELASVPDVVGQGSTVRVRGDAHTLSSYWVVGIPYSLAATSFVPDGEGNWGSISYDGDMQTAGGAIGGYRVDFYTEADPAVGDYLIGANREAVVLSVVSVLARSEKAQAQALRSSESRQTMGDVLRNRRPQRASIARPAGQANH